MLRTEKLESCRDVNNQNSSFRCEWTQSTPSCKDHDGYLDYIKFIYCAFEPDGVPGAVFITILFLLVLFVALGVTADDFLCPALVVISKTLHLSQNIAGVTFLAFGNGAPDIFSSLAGIEQARSDLVIGELFGAGIFVTTVVAGSIFTLTTPFKIMERPFLRDIIFYIFATYWAFYLFFSHQIQLQFAAGFVALYGVYIVVVIVSRIIFQRNKVSPEDPDLSVSNSESTESPSFSSSISTSSSYCYLTDSEENGISNSIKDCIKSTKSFGTQSPAVPIPNLPGDSIQITVSPPDGRNSKSPKNKLFNGVRSDDDPEAAGVVLSRFSYRNTLEIPRRRTLSNHRKEVSPHPEPTPRPQLSIISKETIISTNPMAKNEDINQNRRPPFLQQLSTISMMSLISKGPNDRITPWKDFVFELCPIDVKAWKDRSLFSKILDVLKAPVYFLLSVTTPVVDYEADLHNWCKYLAVLQCITGPNFICFFSKKSNLIIGGSFPLWGLVLIVSILLATLVFFTSIVDEPPFYHAVFAYIGFAVSVMWIYALAHEVVSLLKAIGVVLDLSDTILGLTVLAWGNSIGDFISNTSVARQGLPRMGISACFGGPLLNLLLGIGIPYTVTLVKTGSPIELDYSSLVTVLYGGLAISLVSTLVMMTVLRFEVKRWYGIFLISFYVLFLAVAILVETKVIDI